MVVLNALTLFNVFFLQILFYKYAAIVCYLLFNGVIIVGRAKLSILLKCAFDLY